MSKDPIRRVLLVHNSYQQPGGEDQVFTAEGQLLETYGHEVIRYTVHNDRVKDKNPLTLAGNTVWNRAVYGELRSLIREERPQVAHFHNTLPLISPSAYYAARAEGVPVVQTLHNYRLLCSNALFYREERVCEDCLGKAIPWPGVVHACYRESRAASVATVAMLSAHRALGTWKDAVDSYIALSEFARRKFVEGGLPEEKISVKPNFLDPDPGMGEGRGEYFLFVGRLSREKGVDTLLAAWEQHGGRVPLKIVGDGPLAFSVAESAGRFEETEWLGRQSKAQVLALMRDARALIFPSTCYENFPIVLAEAYSVGLPLIASDLGSMASLVDHDRTGLHFRPGDPYDLASQVQRASMNPALMKRMREEARAEYEAKYTAEKNYSRLMEIYESAVSGSASLTRV